MEDTALCSLLMNLLRSLFTSALAATCLAQDSHRLPTAKRIDPMVVGEETGGFPCNLSVSPDGKHIVTTTAGQNQMLQVWNAVSGKSEANLKLDKSHLYYGLHTNIAGDGSLHIWASMSNGTVQEFVLGSDHSLAASSNKYVLQKPNDENRGANPAGLTLLGNGNILVALNQVWRLNGNKGSVAVINTNNGTVENLDAGGFPLDAVAINDSSAAGFSKAFASSERDDCVNVFQPGRVTRAIKVSAQPTSLLLSSDKKNLFVSCSNGDAIAEINTETEKVVRTILVRPAELRGLPGCTPLGTALAPDQQHLFVALADLNAVGVVDLKAGRISGYLPTGWYPTAVAVTNGGKNLFVVNAKGDHALHPNGDHKGNTYILSRIMGSVQLIDLPSALGSLRKHTSTVVANSGASRIAETLVNPGIKHVVYIVKENRTYDQVFGDINWANGDKSLCMFPEKVTPNQHALAKRFGLFDNFYVCGEVSQNGWAWSTSGMSNENVERNTMSGYSGGDRSYDSEGQNSGSAPELIGKKDIAIGPGGTLWAAAVANGKTLRNYGFFVASDGDADDKDEDDKPLSKDNEPLQKVLQGRTCTSFRQFDMAHPDSEAFEQLGLPMPPKSLIGYGQYKVNSRIAAFRREFQAYKEAGEFPNLTLIRLPRDHTNGTSEGFSAPEAMVADNDYAVGQIVDMISHSQFWKETAIFVLEDDAQAGTDHVDAHRSLSLIISPFTEGKGKADSQFMNTDSFLRTMEALLGLKPLTQYDGTAPFFKGFLAQPSNSAPYNAIMPSKDILAKVNGKKGYKAKESAMLLNPLKETDATDIVLNDILWGYWKGANAARPQTPGVKWPSKTK